MLVWITENLSTLIISIVVFGLMALAVRRIVKNRKKGGCGDCSSCSSGCGGCSGCAYSCQVEPNAQEDTGDSSSPK